jgi:hypothetical protein
MAKPSRTHRVVMSVTFDKPCGTKEAAWHIRNAIYGEFYSSRDLDGPESFKVRGVAPMKRTTKA